MTTVVQGCAVATVDVAGTEHAEGHVVVEGDRIVAVGPGPADPAVVDRADTVVDGRGCLLTPGLVNTHHHLYQWATRGLAQQDDLFGWLTTLYPIWEGLDEDVVGAAAAAGLGWLARTGCTSTTDHHYVFPLDGGDVLGATVLAAREVGLRFHPTRGSMDLGQSQGGLPPDSVVETTEAALAGTLRAVQEHHDPTPGSMLRMGVAPCSPFSVTERLMREAAALARDHGVRLHTHLAETVDEDTFCRSRYDCTPAEYADSLGWLGDDVWLAHCVHVDEAAAKRFADAGTAVAHCPTSNARLGAGLAPVAALRAAGVAVGLGVDGSASNEESSLATELHAAVMVARLREGPAAMTARDALALGTIGGARVLGRADEIGSIEAGKLADLALWRVDGLGHAGCEDPVAALVLGSRPPLALLLVGGDAVVADDVLLTADEDALAGRAAAATRRLLARSRR
ncbi:8-oxoguanine deaminase [Nocardioides iriomotensis]|uniref:8-oxoguanine deaminase n=1 Tax=Nocardioides iriomotensis TaxID=715784 RepID=A0A4Q5IWY7_9ACTN|nr:8-oxoguanine deaminase [Nocardioides iriomotensis]RYU09455.1 8-oxoguanine deaminase [Nocardioides iriomotensis]